MKPPRPLQADPNNARLPAGSDSSRPIIPGQAGGSLLPPAMVKAILIGLAAIGLVTVGIYEGQWTNRWGDSSALAVAAARLERIPAEFNDWVGTSRTMDPLVQRVAGAVGYVDRNYRHRLTGASVDVLLLCGPSGSIAAHTPDVCFAGVGYTMRQAAPVKRFLPGSNSISYWSARFEKASPSDPALLVNWAWGVDGDWSASETPRKDFMLQQALYKLYTTARIPFHDSDGTETATKVDAFLKEFLPLVKNALSSES